MSSRPGLDLRGLGRGWSELPPRARAFRVAHAAYSVVGLSTLGYIWACVATGRRDRYLAASVAFLSMEGVALIIGRGDCPFGPLQAELGDPDPLFALVLPQRAAKAAVPVLTAAALAGMAGLVIRWPRGSQGAPVPANRPGRTTERS